jgi:hypothetical protein
MQSSPRPDAPELVHLISGDSLVNRVSAMSDHCCDPTALRRFDDAKGVTEKVYLTGVCSILSGVSCTLAKASSHDGSSVPSVV